MPQGFTATQATIPPIVKFWLGDMFVDRTVYIENLNFTTDVNFPWEIGLNPTGVECYKLPMIIDVSTTIHLIDDVSDTTSGKAMYDFDVTNVIKRSTNPAIVPTPTPTPNLPNVTVTSSPAKRIPSAQTIPTIPQLPRELGDITLPKNIPTPNIKPLETNIGNIPTPNVTVPGNTPNGGNVPTPNGGNVPTPNGSVPGNTSNDGKADLPTPYNVEKQFGEVRVLGRATAASDMLAMNLAEANAVNEARIKLAVPNGEFNIDIYEVRGDDTHLYKNRDGTYTYESVYNVQFLSKRR
jgi:hypothetical protein